MSHLSPNDQEVRYPEWWIPVGKTMFDASQVTYINSHAFRPFVRLGILHGGWVEIEMTMEEACEVVAKAKRAKRNQA